MVSPRPVIHLILPRFVAAPVSEETLGVCRYLAIQSVHCFGSRYADGRKQHVRAACSRSCGPKLRTLTRQASRHCTWDAFARAVCGPGCKLLR